MVWKQRKTLARSACVKAVSSDATVHAVAAGSFDTKSAVLDDSAMRAVQESSSLQ